MSPVGTKANSLSLLSVTLLIKSVGRFREIYTSVVVCLPLPFISPLSSDGKRSDYVRIVSVNIPCVDSIINWHTKLYSHVRCYGFPSTPSHYFRRRLCSRSFTWAPCCSIVSWPGSFACRPRVGSDRDLGRGFSVRRRRRRCRRGTCRRRSLALGTAHTQSGAVAPPPRPKARVGAGEGLNRGALYSDAATVVASSSDEGVRVKFYGTREGEGREVNRGLELDVPLKPTKRLLTYLVLGEQLRLCWLIISVYDANTRQL